MASSTLRGASAEALAALTDKLGAVSGSDVARVADDLLNAAGIIRGEAGLRRVLTDPSVESPAKAGLVGNIFSGKLSAPAVEIVADAAGRRWTASRDLADALEELGVKGVVKSAGGDAGRLSDEIFAVKTLVESNPDLRTALGDPARSSADKDKLLGEILGDKVLVSTKRLVTQSLDGSHRTVTVALESYQKLADEAHGESSATVRTARELSQADRDRLVQALSTQYGRPIHLNVVLDKNLVGGLRVEIGDDVIDGSVSSRLDDARRKLAG